MTTKTCSSVPVQSLLSRLALLPALTLLLACEGDTDQASPAGETQWSHEAGEAVGALTACTNDTWDFTISYPEGWNTNSGDVMPVCSLFDPGAIEVPVASELPIEIAVRVQREPVEFRDVTGDIHGSRTIRSEAARVAGFPAIRRELESTGDGLLDAGIRSYGYVIDLDGQVLIIATYASGAEPYERKKRVVDAMVATLQISVPSSGMTAQRITYTRVPGKPADTIDPIT
jgi:hypothetical protein